MGKRIIAQRKGRGSPTFRAHTHKRVGPSAYPIVKGLMKGVIKDLIHDPGRGAPLELVQLEDGREFLSVAPEGVYIGQTIMIGEGASPDIGNVLPIGSIPEGTFVCNLELRPYDGGKLVRSSGTYAIIKAHSSDGTVIQLPSGKVVCLNNECRATVGIVAGSGRTEKPFLKAGKKYYWMKSKGKYWPIVRGRAMSAYAHPHGGRSNKPKVVSREAPPGAKVGIIAPRRTGKG